MPFLNASDIFLQELTNLTRRFKLKFIAVLTSFCEILFNYVSTNDPIVIVTAHLQNQLYQLHCIIIKLYRSGQNW